MTLHLKLEGYVWLSGRGGGGKRKQKEKGEEKEWGKNINVISQKKSKPFKF